VEALGRIIMGGRKGIRPIKTEWWGAGVVVCSVVLLKMEVGIRKRAWQRD